MFSSRSFARLSTALALLFISFSVSFADEVYTVPAPEGEGVEGAYSVKVNGQPVAIYCSRENWRWTDPNEYFYGTFEFTGKVTIEIEASVSLANATVAPDRFGVKTIEQTEKKVVLEADRPFQISFEPTGRYRPLLLFGFAPETNKPDPNDPNVVYFGPGVHQQDLVSLKSGQTLYIAAGAVVYGSVTFKNCENVTICGRGILAGTRWGRFQGPEKYIFECNSCKNVVLRDIIIRDPWFWTCTFFNSENIEIDGLRVLASNMINDDAIDLCNSKNITIRNSFIRSMDDTIAIKGWTRGGAACENIQIEDCIFWTDAADVFRIGYECQAEYMRNIRATNCDVLYYCAAHRGLDNPWPAAIIYLEPSQEMVMYNCVFEDFRIRSDGTNVLMLRASAEVCPFDEEMKEPKPGSLRDCVLRNFTVYGPKGDFVGLLNFNGYAEDCDIKNIKIENFDYFGEKVKADSPCVLIQDFTSGIVIE